MRCSLCLVEDGARNTVVTMHEVDVVLRGPQGRGFLGRESDTCKGSEAKGSSKHCKEWKPLCRGEEVWQELTVGAEHILPGEECAFSPAGSALAILQRWTEGR